VEEISMGAQAWAAAASAMIAAFAFVFSVLTGFKTQRDAELRSWQRVVIYSLIEQAAPISFEDLKSKYLQKAQQLLSGKVPKKEIQDDALKRILLDLQKDGVIIRRDDCSYQVQVKVPMEAWAYEELKRLLRERTLKPKLLAIVERESGVHTSDSLVRWLHDQKIMVSFEEVDDLLHQLRGYASLKKGKNGKLEFVPPFDERPQPLAEGLPQASDSD
jgi:hypothetical protein